MRHRVGWVAVSLLTAVMLVSLFPSQTAAQSAIERVKKEGVLRIAITPTAIGFNNKDPKTNELVGVNVEIANRVAKELGVKPEFHEMAFPALFEYLAAKRADIVMAPVFIRPDRQARFAFTDVTYSFGFSAIVRKEETRKFPNMDAVVAEFKKGNLKVGEQTNAMFVKIIKDAGIPTTGLSMYQDKPDAIRDVSLGRLDITFWDTPTLQNFLFLNPELAAKLRIVSEFDSGPSNDNGFPIRFEDKDLVTFVNKVLSEMRQDGSMDAAIRKFGMDPNSLTPTSLRK